MRCSLLLASAVWLATASSLPSSPPANQPAEQPKGKIDYTKWGLGAAGTLFSAGLVKHLMKPDNEWDLVRRIGTRHRLELQGLNSLLDKKKRPAAYKCMKSCITQEFEARYRAGTSRFYHPSLGSAYLMCQQGDDCNLDQTDRIDPSTHKKVVVVPSAAQGKGQQRNVNQFELLAERASNTAHRFAARAGKKLHGTALQVERVGKAAHGQGGQVGKALEEDKVFQLVRHEG
ncbi:MAG: hypothetical protein M1826_004434 [Phylliscum demangeonii]|nr:MAG: hypothetical protein M1826_004434 [Phylliscum demangeonii]